MELCFSWLFNKYYANRELVTMKKSSLSSYSGFNQRWFTSRTSAAARLYGSFSHSSLNIHSIKLIRQFARTYQLFQWVEVQLMQGIILEMFFLRLNVQNYPINFFINRIWVVKLLRCGFFRVFGSLVYILHTLLFRWGFMCNIIRLNSPETHCIS